MSVVVVAGSCDTLLEVDIPGQIAEERLSDPRFADVMTRSVQGSFECALVQHAGATGLLGTELWAASNFAGRDHFNNRIASQVANTGATYTCPGVPAVFSASGAQYQAVALGRDIVGRLEAWTDADLAQRTRHLAVATTYTAFAISLLSEGYCQAVIEPNGPALEPEAIRRAAEEWFTKALGYAESAGDATFRDLALLGRARMRLYLGDRAGAVADAQRIPAGFSFNATYGTVPERQNTIWGETWRDRHVTVHPSFYNLTVGGVADPRVQVQSMGFRGVDNVTASWFPLKYSTASSSVRMASWEEAQLIIAEAQLGQVAVDRINALRAKHGLPLYAPANANDADAILNQVIEERRRELFLEGHWLNDMIRHEGRPGTAFDEGLNHQGITEYRPLYCIPMPDREIDNNPNV